MDWKKLIGQALQRKAALEQQRSGLVSEQASIIDSLGENESLSDPQAARMAEITTAKRSLTEAIDHTADEITGYEREQADDERLTRAAEQRLPGAGAPVDGTQTARTEAREAVYSQRKRQQEGVSFISDIYRMQMGMAPRETQERLQAHGNERAGVLSQRAVNTGAMGSLVPPQYLVDLAAPIARAGRPTANVVRSLPLPAEGMTLTIPRQTTGTAVAVQATQNSSVQNTDAAITDLVIPVVTASGQQDLSRQTIERGAGVDELIFSDLIEAYNVQLDQQVLSGTGSGGQALGILATSGVTQMSAFGAAATASTFWSKLAGAIVAVQTGRYMAPTGIIMHPRRWGWLMSLTDTQGRPLVVPAQAGPFNAQGVFQQPIDTPSAELAGWMQGVPIYTDASVPTSVGTGPEDQVIVARLADALLWEDGDGLPTQLRFEQTLGNQLTVKLVAYGYFAFTAGRYPAANAIIGGNAGAGFGLIAPTF